MHTWSQSGAAFLRKAAVAVVWLMCFAVPLAFLPKSSDTVLLKLSALTGSAGLLLALSGAAFLKKPVVLPLHAFMVTAVAALSVLTLYRPSVYGLTRVFLVTSGAALYLSFAVFRFEARRVIIPLVLGGTAALLVSISLPGYKARLAGTFGNANLLSSYAMAMVPLGLGLLWGRNVWRIVTAVLFSAICFAAILQSGTRAPLVAFPVAAAACVAVTRKPRLLAALAGVYVLVSAAILFQGGLGVPRQGGSIGVRQVIWQGSGEMFLEKPITGWGTGSFHLVFPRFRPGDYGRWGMPPKANHAHSEPVELLVENGMAGFLLFFMVLYPFLRRQTGRTGISSMETGAFAALVLLLIEALFSVSLRWTSAFFLAAMLFAVLHSRSPGRLWKPPRAAGAVLLTGGVFLAGPVTIKAVNMTRSMLVHDTALRYYAEGRSSAELRELCVKSLTLNEWNLESWMLLGDIHMNQATVTVDRSVRIDLLHSALAAWDSLEARSAGYGLLPFNRAVVHSHLGNWNRVLDQMTIILQRHDHLKPRAVDTAMFVMPLADISYSLKFMNLLHSGMLAVQLRAGQSNGFPQSIPPSLGVTYAMAVNHAPAELSGMRSVTDSVLAANGVYAGDWLHEALDGEQSLAREGYSLMQRFSEGHREALEEICMKALKTPGVYAPYHRWLLCALAAESGTGAHYGTAREMSSLLAESCYPLSGVFPGAEEIHALAGEMTPPGQGGMLLESFHHVMLLDAYGREVMDYALGSVSETAPEAAAFWYSNGGPFASAFFGAVPPGNQMERLVRRSMGEPPETRLAMHLAVAAVSFYAGSSDIEGIRDSLCPVVRELVEAHGVESSAAVIRETVESEGEFLSSGAFPKGTAGCVNDIRPILLQCLRILQTPEHVL